MTENLRWISIRKPLLLVILYVSSFLLTACSPQISCTNCGISINASSSFCPNCGSSLSAYQETIKKDYDDSIILPSKADSTPSVWDGSVSETFESGDGTQENPYEIATAEQLAFLAQETNAGRIYYGQFFYLSRNIVLNDGNMVTQHFGKSFETHFVSDSFMHLWEPIGSEGNPFMGSFDGCGHYIEGMVIDDKTSKHIGLFGVIENAQISNIDMRSSHLLGGEAETAGGLIGLAKATNSQSVIVKSSCIDANIWIRGNLKITDGSYPYDAGIAYYSRNLYSIGCIIGKAETDDNSQVFIEECISKGTLTDNVNNLYCRSLVLENNVEIMKVLNGIDFEPKHGFMGGIVGWTPKNTNISSCMNYATIVSQCQLECTSARHIGGIVGFGGHIIMYDCFNMGTIQDSPFNHHVGAIIGNYSGLNWKNSHISNCFFSPDSFPDGFGHKGKNSDISIMVTSTDNLQSEIWLSEYFQVGDIWYINSQNELERIP